MRKEVILEHVVAALPSPPVQDIDLSAPTAVRFTWRGVRYRVSQNFGVEEVQDGMLAGSDAAALMSQLLKKQRELSLREKGLVPA